MITTAIAVLVNGQAVAFPDVQPMLTANDRVVVPMRAVFERLGATVNWREAVNAVSVVKGTINIEMGIGDRTVTVNGERRRTDQAVRLVRGRLLVPLRFISETIGANVHWDGDTRTVRIVDASGPKL